MKDLYETLGLIPEAGDDDIRKAFRTKSYQMHPDKNDSTPESTQAYQELSEAYHTLIDDKKRAKYDRLRAQTKAKVERTVNRQGNVDNGFGLQDFLQTIESLRGRLEDPYINEWLINLLRQDINEEVDLKIIEILENQCTDPLILRAFREKSKISQSIKVRVKLEGIFAKVLELLAKISGKNPGKVRFATSNDENFKEKSNSQKVRFDTSEDSKNSLMQQKLRFFNDIIIEVLNKKDNY